MGTESEAYKPTPPSAQAQQNISEPGTHAYTNRLIDATSPYLLQHAHNPVDWYPWGSEAIEKARREDKPIFLSIGYAACHWCHVMEHQVFENPKIAELMNTHFVNIKVDREERPDLDELYMLATQLMSGSGGWPMSVWLTPELKPFYAGTYFPPDDAYGRPGFPRLEMALAEAWKNRRKELEEQADRVVEAIRMHADEGAGEGDKRATPDQVGAQATAWVRAAIEGFADRFDEVHGGLGSAPKFPPHQALQLWLALLSHPTGLNPAQAGLLRDMLTGTLDGMMNGGIYDHVGGGFARYSTDERWLVPHFEKMLYDSAQLAPVYALASVLLGRADYARIARETLDFYIREMMSPRGAFFSSLDADSAGQEGLYYVFSPEDIRAAIADAAGADLLIEHFGLTERSNWHETPVEGASVLAVVTPVEKLAEKRGLNPGEVRQRIDRLLGELRAFRAKRVRPGLDDKVLTAWNGLMISALAICGRVLREPRYLEAAHRAIGFLLTRHMEGGRRLLRVSRSEAAHTDAFLDDHAYLLNGLMDLIDSTTPTSLPGTMARKRALELADTLIRQFEDTAHGGFFYTGPQHEQLFARMKNAADNATPSANGVAIRALLRLARSSGKEHYRDVALRAVAAFLDNIARRPDYFPTILLALVEDAQRHNLSGSEGGVVGGGGAAGAGGTLADSLPLQALGTIGEANGGGLLKLEVGEVTPVRAGEVFTLGVRVKIPEGYHIQPQESPDTEAFKTVVRMRGELALQSQEWTFPAPTTDAHGQTGYAGELALTAQCVVGANTGPGRYQMRVTLLAQPCSGQACLPPERTTAEFSVTVVK